MVRSLSYARKCSVEKHLSGEIQAYIIYIHMRSGSPAAAAAQAAGPGGKTRQALINPLKLWRIIDEHVCMCGVFAEWSAFLCLAWEGGNVVL